jgi:hypothetical protein
LEVRKGGKKSLKIYLRKKYAKSDKTQPDQDCVSLSARNAFTVYANGKLGKSPHKQKFLYLTIVHI